MGGSTLALGLGELVRVVKENESPKRRKPRNCGDGLEFLPPAQRERILRAAEGVESKSALTAHRAELRCVQKSRAAELENTSNWQPMTTSLEKAHLRATKLATMLQKGAPKGA